MPGSWQGYGVMNGWGLWIVQGVNTESGEMGSTPWQWVVKMRDCVVEFADKEALREPPDLWMPWNYKEQIPQQNP